MDGLLLLFMSTNNDYHL